MRFPAYCLTLFLATAHHQAVGRALAGCQGVFNCATGISTENTPVDGDTWTQTGKDIEHAARVNADTLSEDLARLEQQARDQFASWSRTAARSDPAKDLAAASASRLAALDKEVRSVEADIAKLGQATVDDELAADPAAAASIDADIAEGKFY